MASRYKSKIGIFFLVVFVGLTVAGVYITSASGAWFLIFIPCLTLSFLLRTHYTIEAHSLKIVSGPLRWNIPICEISKVHEDWALARHAAVLSFDVVVLE